MKKKGDSEIWKFPDSDVWKIRKWQNTVKKVRKRTNVAASTEGEVEAEEGSTEARRKDKGWTEVRNTEVIALM